MTYVGNLHFPTPSGPSHLVARNVFIRIHWLRGAVQMSVSQLAGYWGPVSSEQAAWVQRMFSLEGALFLEFLFFA